MAHLARRAARGARRRGRAEWRTRRRRRGVHPRRNPNHTKVLIDGVDVTDPATPNGAFDFSQVLISDVARIEVLRGPQSGLYGSDAIGGVVLIETKKGEGPPRVTGSVEGGSFGTVNQTAGISGAGDKVNYAFNIQHFHADDTQVTPSGLLPPGVPLHDDLYDNLSLSTRLGAGFFADVRCQPDCALHGFAPEVSGSGRPLRLARRGGSRAERASALYPRRDAGDAAGRPHLDNHIGLAYTQDHQREFDPTAPEISDNPVTDTIGHRVMEDWKAEKYVLAPDEKLLFGADAEQDSIIDSPITAANGDEGGFVEWQGRIAGQLFGQASVRYDHNDRFGSVVTWHAAPTYTIADWGTQLKASAGTGSRRRP